MDGDTAARVVGDLETHDLRARRDAGEPADVVEVVTGCNPRHVRAMPRRIEEQIEHRRAVRFAEVRDDREWLGAEGDGFASLPVIVERHLVFERTVEVRVEECHPAVRRLHDHDREFIGVATVAIHVRSRSMTQWQLAEYAAIPGGRGCQACDTCRATHGTFGWRGEWSKRDAALGGEVAELDDFRRAGAGCDESRHVGIDAAVENRDEDAPTIIAGMRRAKDIDTGTLERHEAQHVRHRRLDRGLGRVTAIGRCGNRWRRQWRARPGSCLGSDGLRGRAGCREEEKTGDEWL